MLGPDSEFVDEALQVNHGSLPHVEKVQQIHLWVQCGALGIHIEQDPRRRSSNTRVVSPNANQATTEILLLVRVTEYLVGLVPRISKELVLTALENGLVLIGVTRHNDVQSLDCV